MTLDLIITAYSFFFTDPLLEIWACFFVLALVLMVLYYIVK